MLTNLQHYFRQQNLELVKIGMKTKSEIVLKPYVLQT